MAAKPSPTTAPSFGTLLRTYRLAAGLTQEELAERAGLSLRGISDLERGARQTPRLETVRMLADGLGFDSNSRELAALLSARNATDPPDVVTERGRLPRPPTLLIGRDLEVASIVEWLASHNVRILTLVGTGGVGKTSLALEVANEASYAFPDGVCFVSLASVNDPSLVVATVAHALGLREATGISPQEAVERFLGDKRLLLVLDNFEHILPAAPLISDLLSRCVGLAVLVTSRSPLRLRSEHRYPVRPLELPDNESGRSSTETAQVPAVQLFVARAKDVWAGFTLTDSNVDHVANVVRQLDGLPLALELAAARLSVLTPAELYARLAGQLGILSADRHDAPARHQTMRAAIAWSYDLLPPESQWLFRRLAVFRGGAALDAIAEATGNDPLTVLGGVENLVDHSLLIRNVGADGQTRFRMLEPIRDFALECLEAEGDTLQAQDAHAAWCMSLGERTLAVLRASGRSQWFDRMETELGNLRGALAWLHSQDRLEDAVDLAMGVFFFFHTRGYHSEAFALFKGFLCHPRVASRTSTRAKVLLGHGILVELQGDVKQGLEQMLESVDIFRELGDSVHCGLALVNVGNAYSDVSDFERAEETNRQVIAIGRETGDTWLLKAGLHNLAGILSRRGKVDQALPLFEETLAMDRELDNVYGIELGLQSLASVFLVREEYDRAEALVQEALAILAGLGHQADLSHAKMLLAKVERARGDYTAATVYLGEALSTSRRIDDKFLVAIALIALGDIARLQGDVTGAMSRLREGIALAWHIGSRAVVVEGLEGIAGVAVATRAMEQAARLLGAADALLNVIGMIRPAGGRSADDRAHRQAAQDAIGADAFAAAWSAGHALTPAEAVAEALDFTPDIGARPV